MSSPTPSQRAPSSSPSTAAIAIALWVAWALPLSSAHASVVRSAPVRISVSAPISAPYTLPIAGQAVAIGANVADDVVGHGLPANFVVQYAAFNCFGTGNFVPDFGTFGAFVIASSGGHGCPELTDALVFDFSDQTWKVVLNSNGVPSQQAYFTDADISSQYLEVASGMPASSHLYQTISYIPKNAGGGTNGSYLKLGTIFAGKVADGNPVGIGLGVHAMDLSTGTWRRLTDDIFSTSHYDFYNGQVTVFDEDKRYYFLDAALHNKYGTLADGTGIDRHLVYLENVGSGTWRIKASADAFPQVADSTGSGGSPTYFWDPVAKVIVSQGGSGWPFRYIDPSNIAAGWITVGVSGVALPGTGDQAPRWAYFPSNDCFYTHLDTGGNSIFELCPPASTSPARYASSWSLSMVSVSGATLPDYAKYYGATQTEGPGTFFYVRSIDCLAWISGNASKVIILRPPRR